MPPRKIKPTGLRRNSVRKPQYQPNMMSRLAAENAGAASLRGLQGMQRSAAVGGGMSIALEKKHGPLDRFHASSIPYDISDPDERAQIREMCRIYYRTHNLMSTAVDVYSRFPIQGMEIKCKDAGIQRYYEQLFMEQLEYETFLIDVGQEFFTVGEVNMLAAWNERLGVYDYEQILNPDKLTVTPSLFDPREFRYHLDVPDNVLDIIETQQPKADYQILLRDYPEWVRAARDISGGGLSDMNPLGPGLEVTSELLSRIVNGPQGELYGTPHMLRAFNLLNLEEGLFAAQKAVADRLYSPMILAKIGSPDLGDGTAWIPTEDQLATFTDQMNMALAADTRLLVYHYGVEIESVFGRESVPRFDQDFERLEAKMLEVWGIGEALISGGTSGDAYASSALNSEFLNQLMSSYQKYLKRHFRKRVELIAEVQEHFDYEERGGVHEQIMEEYDFEDEDGEWHVAERPKLLLPELEFASLNVRDEETQRQFIMMLKQAGIPISDGTLMVNSGVNLDDEIDKIKKEKIEKVVAQSQTLVDMANVLQAKGLPVPPEVSAMLAQAPTPPPAPMMTPVTNDIGAPVNTPVLGVDPNAMNLAQQNMQSMMPPAGAAPATPGDPGAAPMAPGMAPSAPAAPGGFGQRPPISDQARGDMPRAAARRRTTDMPSVASVRKGPRPRDLPTVSRRPPGFDQPGFRIAQQARKHNETTGDKPVTGREQRKAKDEPEA